MHIPTTNTKGNRKMSFFQTLIMTIVYDIRLMFIYTSYNILVSKCGNLNAVFYIEYNNNNNIVPWILSCF